MLVFGIIVFQFNDLGMNILYKVIMDKIKIKMGVVFELKFVIMKEMFEKVFVILLDCICYFFEILENNCFYDKWVMQQVEVVDKLYGLFKFIELL